eukprot:s4057_g2.t1
MLRPGFYKKAAAFVLRAVAKHSPPLAQAVIDSGALEALVMCLEEFDPTVKEAAAWALGYIARHSKDLAQSVVDAGAEPELTLKRITASALSDISKHSPQLAQLVVDAGAVTLLTKEITNNDAPLKRQVCSCLSQIAKHSVDLAEVVVESEIFPTILHCLKDVDESVRKNAATCIRELSRHTPDLAKLIVNAGGIAAMVDFVNEARGNCRLPGIMTLGYVAAFSETLALAVVVSKGDHVKAAAAWSLGQIGRHSPDHARALAEADVLRRMLAVKSIIQKCTHLPALEPLIDSPPNILKYVIQQFAKVLPNDIDARRAFVQSGSLQKVQEVGAETGSKLQDFIDSINMLYPPEIVQYYSPNYADKLLSKMEEFNPIAGPERQLRPDMLFINAIAPTGKLGAWNEEFSFAKVQPCDYVADVNGVPGLKAIEFQHIQETPEGLREFLMLTGTYVTQYSHWPELSHGLDFSPDVARVGV